MPFYEFAFIAQQGLTQYELEGLSKGLTALLVKMGLSSLNMSTGASGFCIQYRQE
ncbi:putative ribosomal protein S6 [Anaplasma phagocytophilum str. ApNP]|uniref:Putative ribosomal protein S6 n=1 Tax=Anaplasma phagocytophilum str. ApNP TaxID=1359153 RepID=A0A0F3NG60_ANAPH|nr:putative ribosomal protein S6 [Anaplasma phagocytophilum str. ApNP]